MALTPEIIVRVASTAQAVSWHLDDPLADRTPTISRMGDGD